MKQIHRFLRAARADATALSVCCKLYIQSVCQNMTWATAKPVRNSPDFRVLLNIHGRGLDSVDGIVLLLNKDTHLIDDASGLKERS